MTARRVIVPGAMPSRDANGRALPAKLRFYQPATAFSTPATVYTTADLNVAHDWPLLSDVAGRFPAVWADDANTFDVGFTDQEYDRVIGGPYTNLAPLSDVMIASADQAEASATEAANSAADAAESADEAQTASDAAADLVAVALTGAQDIGTVTGWMTAIVPAVLKSLRVAGYRSAGDGGRALWNRCTAQPSHPGKFRSLDRFLPNGSHDADNGGWWELGERGLAAPDMLGAKRDGTDDADAIDAVAAYLAATGGGVLRLLAGVYGFSRAISLPSGVAIRGASNNARYDLGTVLRATAAGAQLIVGGWGSANASFGGQISDFVIDGANIGTGPLFWIGRALERTFQNIDIHNAVQDGMRVDEAQNCDFINVNSETHGQDSLVLDRGCGGNLFVRCELNFGGRYCVKVTETLGVSTGNYAQPTHNHFLHCILERSTSGTVLFHESGFDNTFTTCVFAAGNPVLTAEAPLVDARNKVSFAGTSRLRLRDCIFSGSSTYSTGLKVAAFAEVLLSGKPKFQGLLHGINTDTGAIVDLDDYVASVIGSDFFVGTGGADTTVRRRFRQAQQVTRTDPLDTALILQVDGSAGAYFRLRASGSMGWASGADFTFDTNLFRQAAGILGTSSKFYAAGGIGVGNRANASAVTGLYQVMPVLGSDGAIIGYVPVYTGFTP